MTVLPGKGNTIGAEKKHGRGNLPLASVSVRDRTVTGRAAPPDSAVLHGRNSPTATRHKADGRRNRRGQKRGGFRPRERIRNLPGNPLSVICRNSFPPDDLNVSSDDSDKSPRRLLHLGQKRKDRDENNKERRPIAPATSRCFVLPERVICPVRTARADFRFAVRGRQRRKGTYQNGRRKGLPAVSTCSGIWKRGTVRRPEPCQPAGFLRRAAACQNGYAGDDFRSMSRHGYF